MAIHTNSYTETPVYAHSNSNYKYYWYFSGGWYNWTEGGKHFNWAEAAYTVARYVQSSSYYQSGTYTELTTNTNTPTAKPIGSMTPSSGSYSTTITIDMSNIVDELSSTITKYRIYTSYSSDQSSWGNWMLLTETLNNTYDWEITSVTAGYYKFAITVENAGGWSALLNTTTNIFYADHTELGNTDDTSYDTSYYFTSTAIQITHYTPPTWITPRNVAKDNIDQIHTEINTARAAFGLSEYTFTSATIVNNFTVITAEDLREARTASNAVYYAAKGENYIFTPTIITENEDKVLINSMIEIQDLLDSL